MAQGPENPAAPAAGKPALQLAVDAKKDAIAEVLRKAGAKE